MRPWYWLSVWLKKTWRKYTPLYKKDTKQNQNKPMDTTLATNRHRVIGDFEFMWRPQTFNCKKSGSTKVWTKKWEMIRSTIKVAIKTKFPSFEMFIELALVKNFVTVIQFVTFSRKTPTYLITEICRSNNYLCLSWWAAYVKFVQFF